MYESNPELTTLETISGLQNQHKTGGSHLHGKFDDFQDKHKYYVDSVIAE